MHTPAELFGSREEAVGAADEVWLGALAGTGWAVIGRDTKIFERPRERQAYRDARVHMFLFPGQMTRADLLSLLAINLKEICVRSAERPPAAFLVRADGLHPL